jgi:hypothetical protein
MSARSITTVARRRRHSLGTQYRTWTAQRQQIQIRRRTSICKTSFYRSRQSCCTHPGKILSYQRICKPMLHRRVSMSSGNVSGFPRHWTGGLGVASYLHRLVFTEVTDCLNPPALCFTPEHVNGWLSVLFSNQAGIVSPSYPRQLANINIFQHTTAPWH